MISRSFLTVYGKPWGLPCGGAPAAKLQRRLRFSCQVERVKNSRIRPLGITSADPMVVLLEKSLRIFLRKTIIKTSGVLLDPLYYTVKYLMVRDGF
ncbi:MAG: hypothetical protein COA43_14435 [Robiginitomaculum sp.]|nr:MAG: hypothetical protein COA43_14435 [Robiginitomaculum sp.]